MKLCVMAPVFRHCPCFWSKTYDIQVLEYSHCSLSDVPSEVFVYEQTLEELFLDANQIKDLPRPLFHCHGLKRLVLNDNEIQSIPPAIASLINLESLDISKNAILEIPDNIKGCKCLHIFEASVNPLGKLPEGLTQLINLEELYLNDTFLEYLPANFGRLAKLKTLELRENRLKILPKSMARMTELTRLDIGQNYFTDVPDVVGSLKKLVEFWCDSNNITTLPSCLGDLKSLSYLDASRNQLNNLTPELGWCVNLSDITLSSNRLKELPDTFGNLKNVTILRLDENCLSALPENIGNLSKLEELILSYNDLKSLPASIGRVTNLHTLIADDNLIEMLPSEMGSCLKLSILSLRDNQLTCIPDELGYLSSLKVLSLTGNMLQFLPFSIAKLPQLQALWLSENQTKPLVPLLSDIDPDTKQHILTCFLLPQVPLEETRDRGCGKDVFDIDEETRQQIKFSSDIAVEEPGKLVRAPTPYPKELKAHAKHVWNYALKLKENGKEGSEILNKEMEENMINGDLPESFIVRTGVPETRVKVKEAKVTKPKYHSPSPHLNEKHLLYKLDKSDTDTSVDLPLVVKTLPIRESKGNALSSTLSSDSPCISVDKSSPSQGVTQLHSNCEVTDSPSLQVSYGAGFLKNRSVSSTWFKREETVDCEQGYSSDHEVYLLHREQLEPHIAPHDGYFSDWESEVGREISHGKLHAPLCTCVSRSSHEDPFTSRILTTVTNYQVPSFHDQLQGSALMWDKNSEAFDYIDNGSENEEQHHQINERDQHLRSSVPNLQHPSYNELEDVVYSPETQNQSGSSLPHGSTRGSLQPHDVTLQYNPRQSLSSSIIPKRPIRVSPPTIRFPHSNKVTDEKLPQVVLSSQISLLRPQGQSSPSTRPGLPQLMSNQPPGFSVVRGPPLTYSGYPTEVALRFPNTASSLQDSQMNVPQSNVLPLDVCYQPFTAFHHHTRPPYSHWHLPPYSSDSCYSQKRQSPTFVQSHSSGFHPHSPTPSCTTPLSMQEALSHFSTSDVGSHTGSDQLEKTRRYQAPISNYRTSHEGNSPTFETKPQLSCSETYQHVSQVIPAHPDQKLQWYNPAGAASQPFAFPKEFLSPGSSGSWASAESSIGNQQNRLDSCGLVAERTNPTPVNVVEYYQSCSSVNSLCPSNGSDRPVSVHSSLSHNSSRLSSFFSMNSSSPDRSTKQLLEPPSGNSSQYYINGLDMCGNTASDAQEPPKNLTPYPKEKLYNEDKLPSSDPPPLSPKLSFQTASLLHGKVMESQLPAPTLRSLPTSAIEYGQSVKKHQSDHLLDSEQITERFYDINFTPVLSVPFSESENNEDKAHTSHSVQVNMVVAEDKSVSPCPSSGARNVNSIVGLETLLSPTGSAGSFCDNHKNKHNEKQSYPKQQNKPITWIFDTHRNLQVVDDINLTNLSGEQASAVLQGPDDFAGVTRC
ncbi:uncharacterized protein LOC143240769 isoform X3 [Tachypleus tridentatus]|uniref:uncharacterized protein LOC143240769 isoform X3 n=1 Tax=Tachypleus tridentatus TaxID=6853 RepID=UPI003FD69D06